jgi:hypothetical protein
MIPLLPLLLLLLLVCTRGAVANANNQPPPAGGGGGGYCYTRMFSFGDSITDTGNQVSFFPTAPAARPPYGETFFGHPTGRYSDGRLVVDFLGRVIVLHSVDRRRRCAATNNLRSHTHAYHHYICS